MQRTALALVPAQALPDSRVPRVLVRSADGAGSPLLGSLHAEGFGVLLLPGPVTRLDLDGVDLVLLDSDHEQAFAELITFRRSPVPVVIALREADGPLEAFLEAGAADGVAAGVRHEELAVRLRAVLRRGRRLPGAEVVRVGEFLLDVARHVFLRGEQVVHLPPKEFGLLALLMQRDGRVVAREEALELVWGPRSSGDATTVDVHVKRLRAKLEVDPARPRHLLTVRGLGYRFEGDPPAETEAPA